MSGNISPIFDGHGGEYKHWRNRQQQRERKEQHGVWYSAFEKMLRVYTELRSLPSVGACQADPLGHRQGLTFPKLDYICEIDVVVRRLLSPDDLHTFRQIVALYSLSESDSERNKAAAKLGIDIHTRSRISEKVGRVLIQRGISPPAIYFKKIKTRPAGRR